MVEKARDLMQIGVRTIEKSNSVYDAIGMLGQHRISGLPVMDGPNLVGIITEKDILQLVFREEHLPGPVEKYMTRNVIMFDEDDSITKIWTYLVRQSYRRVPIVRNGRLTGIISRTDLIRAHMNELRSSVKISEPAFQGPLVREVMTAGLLTTTPDAPIVEAAETLVANGITGLPVVDDSMRLLGILTEKDVLKRLDSPSSQAGQVGDVMTSDVTTFDVNDSLFEVCECLAASSFRRVPVLEKDRLVGIVSRADLILYILKHRSMLFRGRTSVALCAAV